jgi:hypothetical protein
MQSIFIRSFGLGSCWGTKQNDSGNYGNGIPDLLLVQSPPGVTSVLCHQGSSMDKYELIRAREEEAIRNFPLPGEPSNLPLEVKATLIYIKEIEESQGFVNFSGRDRVEIARKFMIEAKVEIIDYCNKLVGMMKNSGYEAALIKNGAFGCGSTIVWVSESRKVSGSLDVGLAEDSSVFSPVGVEGYYMTIQLEKAPGHCLDRTTSFEIEADPRSVFDELRKVVDSQ